MAANLTKAQLAAVIDHTQLKPHATGEMIDELCREARENRFATVCVSPCYVEQASQRLEGSGVLPITVVGFPSGAHLTRTKVEETRHVIAAGAREIDMVIPVGAYLGGDREQVRRDVEAVVEAAGDLSVKAILESGYYEPDQLRDVAQLAIEGGAHYVKTSTGFGPRGASVEDIRIMATAAAQSGRRVGVKASGGIRTLADAKALVEAGATRLGCSASVSIVGELES